MSIGPSLTTRDRTRDPTHPGETPERTTNPIETDRGSFALKYAKWTFDPFNTRPCPEMFDDKWAVSD